MLLRRKKDSGNLESKSQQKKTIVTQKVETESQIDSDESPNVMETDQSALLR